VPEYRPRLVDTRLDELMGVFSAVFLVGPRAVGKTTTAMRVAGDVVRLDEPRQAAAFIADPDSALRARGEPLLLDEWQEVPHVLGAVKRAVDADPRPGRFVLTGSVRREMEQRTWPGTGRLLRVPMFGMTRLEIEGRGDRPSSLIAAMLDPESEILLPEWRPDLVEYVELALQGGFPALVLADVPAHLVSAWAESYLNEVAHRDLKLLDPQRDALRFAEYTRAVAALSATDAEHKTLYDAAGIDRRTALVYDQLLSDLFVAEEVPAWHTNLLSRVTATPKRYFLDPALMAAATGMTRDSTLADGVIMGRLIDTFVVSQLRPQLSGVAGQPTRFHLRTHGGRQEVDVLVEFADGSVVGIEIKASASPSRSDARSLMWLRDELGTRFRAGFLLHTGADVIQWSERVQAIPICALWG